MQAESWFDLSTAWFASVDAAYGTAFREYWSLARLGWRARPNFALGLEGGALGNEEYDAGRGGGFTKVKLRRVEMTLSGGFTGNYLEMIRVATPRSDSVALFESQKNRTAGPAPAVLRLIGMASV